jgi:hypothetical protein
MHTFKIFRPAPILDPTQIDSSNSISPLPWSSHWMTFKQTRKYSKLNEKALDRTFWKTRFGRGYGPV